MEKITYKEMAILLGYKKNHMFERIGCNHYIEDHEHSVKVITKVKLPVYIALFIPACILQAMALVWDGGLKEFSIEPRTIHTNIAWKNNERYKKFAERG